MRKLMLLALLLALLTSLPAAAQGQGNLVEVAANDGSLTTFVAALEAAGVAPTLRGTDNYTVFAPTDEAFTQFMGLLGITADELFGDTERLRALVLNHIVYGSLGSATLAETPTVLTVSENTLSVNAVDGTLLIGNIARVARPDIQAANGIIHAIDMVLLPPAEATAVAQVTPTIITLVVTPTLAPPTIAPPQAAEPSFLRVAHFSPDTPGVDAFVDGVLSGFSALEFGQVTDWTPFPASTYQFAFAPQGSLIEEALYGPVEVVIPPGSWTTLAVLGSRATATLRIAVVDETMRNPLTSQNARVTLFHTVEGGPDISLAVGQGIVLVDHVAYGDYTSLDMPAAEYDFQVDDSATGRALAGLPDQTLLPGGNYLIAATGTTALPGMAMKAVTRAQLDSLTDAQSEATAQSATGSADLLTAAAADGRFTILLTAIEAAQLEDTLRGAGPFTLLAPTDDAFAALPAGMMDTLLHNPTALRNLLLYHVVVGQFSSGELGAQDTIMTALGVPVVMTREDDLALLNDSVVFVGADIPASNGVIHAIDAVLVPLTP